MPTELIVGGAIILVVVLGIAWLSHRGSKTETKG